MLVGYAALSVPMDPAGFLGTDTGAKVATLEHMERGDGTTPDVGYWAEEWDPEGTVHPLYQTYLTTDGTWVAVTTLPMLEVARPLYELGGYRLTLLLPMLGAVACAFAARAISTRVGGDGWTAFWVVGAASPIVVYALDLWEHSIGVAAMVGGVALVLDVVAERPGRWRALAAGGLFGVAATLRTEALVYALVAVGVGAGTVWIQQGSVARAVRLGGGVVGGGRRRLARQRGAGGVGGRASRARSAPVALRAASARSWASGCARPRSPSSG